MDTIAVLFPSLPSPKEIDGTRTVIYTYTNHVLNRPGDRLSAVDSANFYTAVYNYTISSYFSPGWRELWQDAGRSSESFSHLGVMQLILVERPLESHVQSFMTITDNLEEDELLRYYMQEWNRYTTSLEILRKGFAYRDRFCGNRVNLKKKDTPRDSMNELYTINELGRIIWGGVFVKHIQENNKKLTKALLRLVTLDRNNEPIDHDLLKDVLQTLVSLRPKADDAGLKWSKFHENCFEDGFIQMTAEYYQEKSDNFMKGCTNIFNYLMEAENWLKEEETRIDRYVYEGTKNVAMEKCRQILIYRFEDLMRETLLALPEPGQDEEKETKSTLGAERETNSQCGMDDVEKHQFLHSLLSRIPGLSY